MKSLSNMKPFTNTHLKHHLASDPDKCKHARFGLRGCTLTKEHDGPHMNGWAHDGATWEDDGGLFINSHADWVKLVNALGKR